MEEFPHGFEWGAGLEKFVFGTLGDLFTLIEEDDAVGVV